MGTEFKIGDRVVVKSWEEMEVEYGVGASGNIACRCSFPKSMRNFCGKEGVIEHIYGRIDDTAKVDIKFNHSDINTEAKKWTFSTDMIKHVITSKENWIKNMYRKFLEDKNCFDMLDESFTIVVNKTTLKSAVAKCSPDDEYDFYTGIAIAYARLTGVRVPNFANYKRLGDVGLFDNFKYGGSTYGIIGINRKTNEIYVYDVSTGNTNHYKPDTMVEVID